MSTLPHAGPNRAEAYKCGSHDTPAPDHASIHLGALGPGFIGNDALMGQLYTQAKATDNPLQYGGASYDHYVYALEVAPHHRRSMARHAGLERRAELGFNKVVGVIFHSDGTGHMEVTQYRALDEFTRAVEREREIDEEAERRQEADARERATWRLVEEGDSTAG